MCTRDPQRRAQVAQFSSLSLITGGLACNPHSMGVCQAGGVRAGRAKRRACLHGFLWVSMGAQTVWACARVRGAAGGCGCTSVPVCVHVVSDVVCGSSPAPCPSGYNHCCVRVCVNVSMVPIHVSVCLCVHVYVNTHTHLGVCVCLCGNHRLLATSRLGCWTRSRKNNKWLEG